MLGKAEEEQARTEATRQAVQQHTNALERDMEILLGQEEALVLAKEAIIQEGT